MILPVRIAERVECVVTGTVGRGNICDHTSTRVTMETVAQNVGQLTLTVGCVWTRLV